jgi:hypothetical protein
VPLAGEGILKSGPDTQWTIIHLLKIEILSLVAKWMELEFILLNEIRQTQKDKYYMPSFTYGGYVKQWLLEARKDGGGEGLDGGG